MRKINKHISLEPYKSRLPGVAPAISGGTFVDFIEPEHIRRGYGNYGLVPSDVIIPKEIASAITDYTDIYVNLVSGDGGYALLEDCTEVPTENGIFDRKVYLDGDKKTVITYQTLMAWYHFMLEYMDLIEGSWCRSYTSATEYFDIQIGGSPIERERYEEMDRRFNSRGGKPFFDWVSDNIIPTFVIPKQYRDKWGTKRIYYPDALVWKGWFDARRQKYWNITDCKLSDDCCDCEEYFSRGGNDMWMLLDEWCEKVRNRIIDNNGNFTREASLNIPISLVRSVDNMGEMSMFSTEWEPGVDYGRTQSSADTFGTVTYYNESGGTYAILGQQKGYSFNKDYMEIEFATDMWKDYTYSYINEHYSDFIPVTSYAYNRYGVIVVNPQDSDFTRTYPYVDKDVVLIGDTLYDVVDGFWVAFKGGSGSLIDGKRLQVDFSSNGIPYTVVNRRKYVGKKAGNNYFFNFGSKEHPMSSPMVEGKFIKYGGKLYDVEDGSVNIEGVSFKVLGGYFVYEDGNRYYIYDDALCEPYFEDRAVQEFEPVERADWKSSYVNGDGTVSIVEAYEVHESRYITGFTSNKSHDVIDKVVSTDDIGNELPGRLVDKGDGNSYFQPSEGELLDLYFHVGNVTNLSSIADEDEDTRLMNGDIITSMEFFYLGKDGKDIGQSVKRYITDSGEIENDGNTSIELIDQLDALVDGMENVDKSKVYCIMTYHIGAILTADADGPLYGKRRVYTFKTENESDTSIEAERHNGGSPQVFNITIVSSGCDEDISNEVAFKKIYVAKEDGNYKYYPGIVYKDLLILEKDECFYNLSEDENYPLNYYNVTVNAYDPTKMNEMDDSMYTQHSYFETPILIYARNTEGEVEADEAYYRSHFAKYNNLIASPMFRHDWQFGLSSRESLQSDIYVDRGSVTALDKHLKLGEVKTMEALENYSNGMLKIKQDQ